MFCFFFEEEKIVVTKTGIERAIFTFFKLKIKSLKSILHKHDKLIAYPLEVVRVCS